MSGVTSAGARGMVWLSSQADCTIRAIRARRVRFQDVRALCDQEDLLKKHTTCVRRLAQHESPHVFHRGWNLFGWGTAESKNEAMTRLFAGIVSRERPEPQPLV